MVAVAVTPYRRAAVRVLAAKAGEASTRERRRNPMDDGRGSASERAAAAEVVTGEGAGAGVLAWAT